MNVYVSVCVVIIVPMSYAVTWWVTQSTPLVTVVLIATFGPLVMFKKGDRTSMWPRITSTCLQVLNFFYFSVAANTLAVFDCKFNGVVNVMSSEPSVICDLQDPVYSQIFLPALVYSAVYLMGIPLLYFLLLHRNRVEIKRIQSSESHQGPHHPSVNLTSTSLSVPQKKGGLINQDDESLVALTYGFLFKHYSPSVSDTFHILH